MNYSIFKDIQQLRDYITVDISSTLDTIAPYLKQAEKFVREITGDELFDLLIPYVENQEPGDARLDKLLPYCRLALANFGYMLAIDKLNVNVGQTGITVTVSNNLEPASQWRVDAFKQNLESTGYSALEGLIKFLEENRTDFPEWVSSDAYSYQKKFFVNNASEFKQYTEINISRLDFLKLKKFIKLAEIEIQGILCNDLFYEIKQEFKDESISANNQKLLEWILPAVCYSALNKQEENELYRNEANRLKESLRIYLNRNADTYPLYKNSECYSSGASDIDYGDSCVYGFGL